MLRYNISSGGLPLPLWLDLELKLMFDHCAMEAMCIAAYQGLSRFGYVHNLDPDTQLNRIDTTNDTKQHRLK